MGIAFDDAPDRPEHIDAILNGLDRYNPETTAVFQDYVTQQCEDRTYDCYANLALLKLWVFCSHVQLSQANGTWQRDDRTNVSYYLTVYTSTLNQLNLHLKHFY